MVVVVVIMEGIAISPLPSCSLVNQEPSGTLMTRISSKCQTLPAAEEHKPAVILLQAALQVNKPKNMAIIRQASRQETKIQNSQDRRWDLILHNK